MEKTRHPGIYKRGSRYVVVYRAGGKQRKESARTLDEARRLKARRVADVDRGEFQERSRITLAEYATEWVERYRPRGLREYTRQDYRRILRHFVLKPEGYFSERLKLSEVTLRHVQDFAGWLCESERGRGGTELADKSVRNYVGVLGACLGTARREGLITHNPAHGVQLPHRQRVDDVADDDDGGEVRAFSREQLAAFLAIVHPAHRVFFELLASTGVRVSEAIGLQWQHVQLDGEQPHVKVRRGIVRGVIGPPKSKYGRREVPISRDLVDTLRARRVASGGDRDALVFPNAAGKAWNVSNLRNRVLKPAAEEADCSWAGFHTFRHTRAALLIASARNPIQVQRWLGHHSPAFTLAKYGHLMDGDLGEPLNLADELASPVRTLRVPAALAPVTDGANAIAIGGSL